MMERVKVEQGTGDRWHNITEVCRAAAAGMEVGEMVHSTDFNLFDAMSALELMDPKMDDAMQEPVEGVQSRIDRGVLPIHVTLEVAVAVADKLLPYEVAWYEGATLLDSVFTCLYLHSHALHPLMQACQTRKEKGLIVREEVMECGRPATLALLAILMATLKTVHAVRKMILLADIYEEEDSSPNSFGLYLGENLADDDALFLLDAAEDMLRHVQGEVSHAPDHESTLPPIAADHAVFRHLSFRRKFLMAAFELNRFRVTEEEDLPRFREAITSASHALSALKLRDSPGDDAAAEVQRSAFDGGVSRSLKGNAPRRFVHVPPSPDAVACLQRLLSDIMSALSIFDSAVSLSHVRNALERWSTTDPNIAARSFLHLHLTDPDGEALLGRLHLESAVIQNMAALGVPVSVLATMPYRTSIPTCGKTAVDCMRIYLHNRSRQRTRLEVLFQDLAVIQEEAGRMDTLVHQELGLPKHSMRYMTNWIMDDTLRAMAHYITLGLELGLYIAEEMPMVLYYLDLLVSMRLNLLSQMDQHRSELQRLKLEVEDEEERRQKAQIRGSATSKKKKKKAHAAEKAKSTRKVEFEDARPDDPALRDVSIAFGMRRLLVRGLECFLVAIYKSSYGGPPPDPAFCSWAERFFHRFKAFLPLQHPAMATYEQYLSTLTLSPEPGEACEADHSEPVGVHLGEAKECFRLAKTLVERMLPDEQDEQSKDSLKQLAKVAVANSVSIAQVEVRLLRAASAGDTSIQPRLVFSVHKQLPVVSLA